MKNRQILEAATRGRSSITDPQSRYPYPSGDEIDAMYLQLKTEGYTVVHHPDPDPGDPCSRPYTTISW